MRIHGGIRPSPTVVRVTTLPWTTVLLDVDGTLVDSADVVIRAFHRTLADLGLPEREDRELAVFVGPPLVESFTALGLAGDALDAAVVHYREIYHTLYLEPAVYAGIPGLLADLDRAGVALATATSKQEYMARTQLDHLGLLPHFRVVAGATPDPACTKATVLRDALDRLDAAGIDTSRPVLVGDRSWDVEGGAEVGVPVIGAGWGYAAPGELGGALAIAPDVASARGLLLGSASA